MRFASLLPCAALTAVAATNHDLRAQFAEGFDSSGANVKINQDPDTLVQFVDYSNMTIGATNFAIPEAPRQVAGSAATRGIVMQANITTNTLSTVNVLAGSTPIAFSGRYKVSFDAWMNLGTGANQPTTGTTEQLLWGAGVDDTLPLEGRPYRLGAVMGAWGWLANENGYGSEDAAIWQDNLRLQNRADGTAAALFNAAFPAPWAGGPNDAPANSWVQVDIEVDYPHVRVFFNGVKFFDQVDTATDGFAMLGYEDPFSGSMGPAASIDYGWALFDNFTVCVLPVPAGIFHELDDVNNAAWNMTPEVGSGNAAHYGNLNGSSGEHDVWAFTVGCRSDVVIYTTERGVAGTCTDPIIDLRDSAGVIIATNDDEPGAPGNFSLIKATLEPGQYYVDVRPFSSNAGDYALDIVCNYAVPVPSYTNSNEVEPNNDQTSTDTANCFDRKIGTLSVAGDTDFYRVTVAANATYTFETHADTSTSGIAVGDSQVWLYDNTMALIAQDDDGGAGLYSLLTRTLTPAGSPYYIEVSHWQRNGTGDYSMTVACDDSVRATQLVDSSSAGCLGTSGFPIAINARVGERPLRNAPYAYDVTNAPAGAVVLFGTVGVPSPDLDMALIGAPGCFYSTTSFVSLPLVPTVGTEAEFSVSLFPVSDGLIGALLEMQVAAIDIGANALGVIMSNRITGTLGDAP